MFSVLNKIAYRFMSLFFRTYFDNIVAIDSLLEHIMVGAFSFANDFIEP